MLTPAYADDQEEIGSNAVKCYSLMILTGISLLSKEREW